MIETNTTKFTLFGKYCSLILAAVLLCSAPASAMCQRPDGTYTDQCAEEDPEVNLDEAYVTRSDSLRRSLDRRKAMRHAAEPKATPEGVALFPTPTVDPRTYWRNQRYDLEVRMGQLKAQYETRKQSIAACKRWAGIRREGHCIGDPDSLDKEFRERERKAWAYLQNECRRDEQCQPGWIRP